MNHTRSTRPGAWRRPIITVLALSVVSLLATACEPAPEPSETKPAVPASGAYFGSWIKPRPGMWDKAGVKQMYAERENRIGRKYAIGHHFQTFFDDFPTWREPWHLDQGRIPMISWNGTDSGDVLDGDHDALIRDRARGVKALDAPVFLRYFWEPDAQKKDHLNESPQEYIDAWNYVQAIWAQEGVDNAAWVWCPTAWGFTTGQAQEFYPGDANVDWVCADGYNWGDRHDNPSWRQWSQIYDDAYAFATAHDKPMMAGEYGTVERYDADGNLIPGEKAAWYRDAAASIPDEMPGIKAVVHFDSQRYEDGFNHPWRPNTTEASMEGYADWANADWFAPMSQS